VLASWAESRGIKPSEARVGASIGVGSAAGPHEIDGATQVASILLSGVEVLVDVMLVAKDSMDPLQGQALACMSHVVVGAQTQCRWPAAREAVQKAVEVAVGRSFTDFMDTLCLFWPGVGEDNEGMLLAGQGHFTERRAAEKANVRDSFVDWVRGRRLLGRFEPGGIGYAWDYPTSKAEKRELLLLHVIAEQNVDQYERAADKRLSLSAMSGRCASQCQDTREEVVA